VKRLLLIFTVAMGFMLVGCDASNTQNERAGKERGPEKAAKYERPGSDAKETKPSERGSQDPPSATSAQYSTSPAPEEVLSSQYERINAGRYRAAYYLFADESQQIVSLEDYKAYFASAAPYEITSYSFASVQTQGEEASVVADLAVSSASGEDAYRVTQQLVREDGSWRVVMRDAQVASFTDAGSSPGSPSASSSASSRSAPSGAFREDQDASTVMVSRVVDGDTIEISPAVEGLDEVRLIGVDTPETKDPEEGIEPYGPEATAFATEELDGQGVDLEFGQEMEDQYGRLLAYVYVGGEMFNEILLEEGYAQAYPYEPNTKYEERFASAQADARAADLGIWGLSHAQQCELADRGNGIGEGTPGCEGASASPSASASASASAEGAAGGAVPPISEEHCPPNAPIKGNASSGIYHMPDDAYYDATHPEECFATPQDAEAAGYRAAKV
jgi:micrococcal nuclease